MRVRLIQTLARQFFYSREGLETCLSCRNRSNSAFEGRTALPPGEGLAIEARLQADLLGGGNMVEAVMANIGKRAPKFR